MRTLCLALCCALSAATCAQAESYSGRDSDDGFNPFGVMRDMPSPMSMFDSSDKHRRDRHRPRPPRHLPPPIPGYPGMAYPPTAPAPYAYPPGPQPTQGNVPTPTVPTPGYSYQSPQPPLSTGSSQQPISPVVPTQQDNARTSYPQATDNNYNYRPTDSDSASPMPTESSQGKATNDTTTLAQPSSDQPGVRDDSQEPVMYNGKPAVFRPMNLGVEETTN